jgi:DNA segregation ATPase FtsK/SpoIIIE, S-DNA-T family
MVGRRGHTVFANGGTVVARGRGWWTERARQRAQAQADAELISELRWQWRSVCAATSLSQMMYTPSGATRGVPMIEHVDLGPPISLVVKMRPGQRLADFDAVAPVIAPALGATALEVTPLAAPWVRVVLRQAPLVALPGRSFESDTEALRFGA